MPIFKIKEVEDIRTAFIFHVEAETAEEALCLYNTQLAGGLPLQYDYVDDNSPLGVSVIK